MYWIKATVYTSSNGIEPVSAILYDYGISGLEIEDENEFNDFLEQNRNSWDYVEETLIQQMKGDTRIRFYIPGNASSADIIAEIKQELNRLKQQDQDNTYGKLEIAIENISEKQWEENWKKYFKPVAVGSKILIKPTWEHVPEGMKDRIVFEIEPGMVFGTGTHITTQLCIRLIEKYLQKGDSVLDLGCGTGILSIICMILGASEAVAIDIDSAAVPIAGANARMNGISEDKYIVFSADVIKDKNLHDMLAAKRFNIILANIVADVIINLSEFLSNWLNVGGLFIASGIIDERKEEVIQCFNKMGFELIDSINEEGWVAIIFRCQNSLCNQNR